MKKLLLLFFSFCIFFSVHAQNKNPGNALDTLHAIPYDTSKIFLLDSKVGYVIDSAEKATFHLFTFWGPKTFWYAEMYSLDKNKVLLEATMRDKTVRQLILPDYQVTVLQEQIESI